jgi:hypothetical protein
VLLAVLDMAADRSIVEDYQSECRHVWCEGFLSNSVRTVFVNRQQDGDIMCVSTLLFDSRAMVYLLVVVVEVVVVVVGRCCRVEGPGRYQYSKVLAHVVAVGNSFEEK